jgi:hypothetical protein
MRGFASSRLDYRRMVARVRFAEAPPSVEERALFSAFTASVAFGILGFLFSHFQNSLPKDLPTDIPVVFLTLPGLAAAWFGFSSDADTVLRSSLAARISLIVTTLLSLAGVSCYLLQAFLHWTAGPKWEFFGINEYLWLVLFGLSLINIAAIGFKTVSRMLLFVWLSTKRDVDSSEVMTVNISNRTEDVHDILAS